MYGAIFLQATNMSVTEQYLISNTMQKSAMFWKKLNDLLQNIVVWWWRFERLYPCSTMHFLLHPAQNLAFWALENFYSQHAWNGWRQVPLYERNNVLPNITLVHLWLKNQLLLFLCIDSFLRQGMKGVKHWGIRRQGQWHCSYQLPNYQLYIHFNLSVGATESHKLTVWGITVLTTLSYLVHNCTVLLQIGQFNYALHAL